MAALGCGAPKAPLPPSGSPHASSGGVEPVPTSVDVPVAAFSDPRRRDKLASTFPELSSLVDSEAQAGHIPALAVGVVIDGELAFARYVGTRSTSGGTLDGSSLFRIGSITKTMTALALLKLRDEGRLTLDAPLISLLPEARALVSPWRDAAPVTLADLLAHRSGLSRAPVLPADPGPLDPASGDVLAGLSLTALESPPGEETRYSNTGYSLLGIALERASGRSYRDYVLSEVLRPIGMAGATFSAASVPETNRTASYRRTPAGDLQLEPGWSTRASDPALGLHATLPDLGRYAGFQLSAWPARSDTEAGPVRRSSVRQAHAAGIGWKAERTCDGAPIAFHGGAVEGFRATIRILPEHGVAVIALANVEDADVDGLGERALAVLGRGGGLAARELPAGVELARAAETVASLVGAYSERRVDESFRSDWLHPVRRRELRERLSAIARDHGRCEVDRSVAVASRTAGNFILRCDRGFVTVDVVLDAATAPVIRSVRFGDSDSAGERALGERATSPRARPVCPPPSP
jgi:CubicO group peptidase (beta-lactamase class C family)